MTNLKNQFFNILRHIVFSIQVFLKDFKDRKIQKHKTEHQIVLIIYGMSCNVLIFIKYQSYFKVFVMCCKMLMGFNCYFIAKSVIVSYNM